MSHVNRGKEFEGQIRQAFESVPNTSVIRLIDPQNGFAGVRNICDFIVYHYPYQYLIECKSCYGNTLPFSNITDNQWQGLKTMSVMKGIVAGIIVWFIDHDLTLFAPIQLLVDLKSAGKKSLRYDQSDILPIPATKKRILFNYDMTEFLNENWEDG